MALADLPLKTILTEELIPSDTDEVSRLIQDRHDPAAFAAVSSLTVGELREWLLAPETAQRELEDLTPGLTPEMVAAVSKIMRLQDLISVASKREVVTKFRSTIGLKGRLSTRNQPNHPIDDSYGIAASALDGLLMGSGDAVIGQSRHRYGGGLCPHRRTAGRVAHAPGDPDTDLLPWSRDDGNEGDGGEGAGGSRVPIGRRLAKGE
jgi:ethanolamine ammonia-lyase large subunit